MLVLAAAPAILTIWAIVQVVAIRRAVDRMARTLEAVVARERL
ncbi:MAG TPA: hypothetical protein VIJ16_04145 [Gemmatimonadaceae bacterium]